MSLPITKCGECGLRTQDGAHCSLTGFNINPAVDFCSKASKEPKVCEVCGRHIVVRAAILEKLDDKWHEVCMKCAEAYGTCHRCGNARTCDFDTNSSPLPKVVQKQVKHGNMIAVTTVQNPDRIAATCAKGCSCYREDTGCVRQQAQTCGKFEAFYQEV